MRMCRRIEYKRCRCFPVRGVFARVHVHTFVRARMHPCCAVSAGDTLFMRPLRTLKHLLNGPTEMLTDTLAAWRCIGTQNARGHTTGKERERKQRLIISELPEAVLLPKIRDILQV